MYIWGKSKVSKTRTFLWFLQQNGGKDGWGETEGNTNWNYDSIWDSIWKSLERMNPEFLLSMRQVPTFLNKKEAKEMRFYTEEFSRLGYSQYIYLRNSLKSTLCEDEGLADNQRMIFKICIHKTFSKSNGQNNKWLMTSPHEWNMEFRVWKYSFSRYFLAPWQTIIPWCIAFVTTWWTQIFHTTMHEKGRQNSVGWTFYG